MNGYNAQIIGYVFKEIMLDITLFLNLVKYSGFNMCVPKKIIIN